MAEGTRLKDRHEHMLTLESRMHKLTTDYQDRVVELTAQIKEVSDIKQKHYESLQVEAVRRHELILKDSAAKHEELLTLLASRNSQTAVADKTYTIPSGQKEYQNIHGYKSVKLEFKDNKGKGILPNPLRESDLRDEDRGESVTGKNTHHHHTPYPRLEFPTFTGDEPRVWMENCQQYFEVYQIPQYFEVSLYNPRGR